MTNDSSFKRITITSAIISLPLALAANLILMLAVKFDFNLMADQTGLLTLGARAAKTMRLGETAGLFGYYLLLVPVVLYLGYRLKSRSPNLVTMYTVFGLAFVVVGIIAASLRAVVVPEMMSAYAQATDAQSQILSVEFQTVVDLVFGAMGPLESMLAGFWLLGIGLELRRERRALGNVAAILGIAFLGDALGLMLHFEPLSVLELGWFISPFWVFGLGLFVWREARFSRQEAERVPAV